MTGVPVTPRCPDCQAKVGQRHDVGCHVARCLWTGGQRIQCDKGLCAAVCRALLATGTHENRNLAEELAEYLSLDDPDHDCGQEEWSGEWPGDADAARLGWWIYWGPDYGGRGWVPCTSDHPGARPDLNRLNEIHARWDREAGRWEART